MKEISRQHQGRGFLSCFFYLLITQKGNTGQPGKVMSGGFTGVNMNVEDESESKKNHSDASTCKNVSSSSSWKSVCASDLLAEFCQC